jgi:threonine synthase
MTICALQPRGLAARPTPDVSACMFFTHLACGLCGKEHSKDELQTVCRECGRPLLARYDLAAARSKIDTKILAARRLASLWRYRELLPLPLDVDPVTLDEGWTPLLPAPRLGRKLDLPKLHIKDESQNPTATFKARGMTAAISLARFFGIRKVAAPSAGNAAGALAVYAARAGIEAHLFMPKDTPKANVIECLAVGAHVTLMDGLITDCGAEVARRKEQEGWFDLSTLKEPYRVEGKKTLGYELAEQLDWTLPDVVFYPTGGGTGLIGMWKAFDEMEQLGWISSKRPRMVSVQAAGCCPIVTAFEKGERFAEEHRNAATIASGLRVPKAIGDFLILDAVRASNGIAISVTDDEMIAAARKLGKIEGIFAAPEGAACIAALEQLRESGWIKANESVTVFNTGSGIKYLECYDL